MELKVKQNVKAFVAALPYHVKAVAILSLERIKVRWAIRRADMLQYIRNRRVHVSVFDDVSPNGKRSLTMMVLDNHDFDRLKRVGYLPKRMSYIDWMKKTVYSTPESRNNSSTREERLLAEAKYESIARLFYGIAPKAKKAKR